MRPVQHVVDKARVVRVRGMAGYKGANMNSRDSALDSLQRRMREAHVTKSAAGLFSAEALREAGVLARAAESGEDLQAAHLLGMFHWFRYLALPEPHDRRDFDTAVRFLRPVYRVRPRDVPTQLHGLFAGDESGFDAAAAAGHAIQLFEEFQSTGKVPTLVRAVALLRRALQATAEDDPDLAARLTNLGIMLQGLFMRSGDMRLLVEAERVGRRAVAATPEDRPERGSVLNNLGITLHLLFEQSGNPAPLVEAVDVGRRAVAAASADDPGRAGSLNNLGITLRSLFELSGDTALAVEGVQVAREALEATPADHPNRAICLGSLGAALLLLFEWGGDTALMAEAVEVGRQAVAATPAGHPDLGGRLNNLGAALRVMFVRTGDAGALTEAVEVGRRAVAATPADHYDRAGRLSNLGNALYRLFERSGDTALLVEGWEVGRQAVAATPAGHSSRAMRLNNLGIALMAMSQRNGDSGLLAEAVDVYRQAVVDAPAEHTERAKHLANLGTALRALFEQSGDLALLAEAVDVGRQCVAHVPPEHPNRAGHLTNLGTVLRALFERNGDAGLLLEAVLIGRQALAAAPIGHPDRAVYLDSLGNALQATHENHQDPAVLSEALDCFRKASHILTAPVNMRIQALRQFAALAGTERSYAREGLAAIESAVLLLPQTSPRTLAHEDREYQVGQHALMASAAAAAALNADNPPRAVELLEATRGLLVADSLDARSSDLAGLRRHDPELARRFEELRARRELLDRPDTGHTAAPIDSAVHDQTGARDSRHADHELGRERVQVHIEWDRLVERIHAIDGFSRFLAAPSITELTSQAADGPIVFLSADPTRCDALILTGSATDPVRTVRLDTLTQDDALQRIGLLLAAQETAADDDQSPATRIAAQQTVLDVLAWLWDTVAEPVLTALGHIGSPADGQSWPRVWWCPIGMMAYLPVHAAGHHRDLLADDPAAVVRPRTVLAGPLLLHPNRASPGIRPFPAPGHGGRGTDRRGTRCPGNSPSSRCQPRSRPHRQVDPACPTAGPSHARRGAERAADAPLGPLLLPWVGRVERPGLQSPAALRPPRSPVDRLRYQYPASDRRVGVPVRL